MDNQPDKPGKFDKLKDHVARHKVAYSFAAGVVVTSVTLIVFKRCVNSHTMGSATNTTFFSFLSPQTATTNTYVTDLTRRGHPGKIIRCKETGELFASIHRGADMMGVNRGNLSSHLAGRLPSVGGHTFEFLGEAV